MTSWEEHLPLIEFAYNRVIHSSTGMTPFECAYGINPLTSLDSTPFPSDLVMSLDGSKRAEAMKKLHEKVEMVEDGNDSNLRTNFLQDEEDDTGIPSLRPFTRSQARELQRLQALFTFLTIILELGDWVWVHLRKDRFPSLRNSKLMPRGDGPFQVLERINDNAYKIDLPPEYQVHNTFNVRDLSQVETVEDGNDPNLRTNSLQDGEDDTGIPSLRPFTRSQARELQRLQSLFTFLTMCEALVSPSKGLYLIKCEETHQDIPNPPT
ncbi:hypothetical protein FXO38_17853 [Capsicum annuum]|nr:hypothetical protein FXO38_17853 [Capsicum annuum]